MPRWLRMPFADPFRVAVQHCSAVGECVESAADLLPPRPKIADLFGQGGSPYPLQVVEGGGTFDQQSFGLAQANLGGNVANGASDRSDNDAGEHGDSF
jgi:hypothetical protein